MTELKAALPSWGEIVCVFCNQPTLRVAFIHNEFGMSCMPMTSNPNDPLWNHMEEGAPVYDKNKPYCLSCYFEANKDDKQIKGWNIANTIVGKHYTEVMNRSKESMMAWLDGGALDSRRKEQ